MPEDDPLPSVIIPDHPDYFADEEKAELQDRKIRCIKIHRATEDFLRKPEIPRDDYDFPISSYPHEVHPQVPVGTLGKTSYFTLRIVGGAGTCILLEWFLDDGTECAHLYNRPEFKEHCEFTDT